MTPGRPDRNSDGSPDGAEASVSQRGPLSSSLCAMSMGRGAFSCAGPSPASGPEQPQATSPLPCSQHSSGKWVHEGTYSGTGHGRKATRRSLAWGPPCTLAVLLTPSGPLIVHPSDPFRNVATPGTKDVPHLHFLSPDPCTFQGCRLVHSMIREVLNLYL